ncbi:competence protein CoiA family protein [Salisediminibacterium halotolerans]|uniref:competence protein CoiA family protein n=1 Tax=Salisediminibacterium halotolerans TaxID=517425 RepID=UPI000EADB421|nr:competence protein CoiA family protein [Salisediminibacterium halotolerans]RLJ74441.1 competence CoiA-like predicted nuclease [Actinophytocola xinjiangensis]RPE87466.1 competence CoiA-like predicted nuclease [Salisediminibacterium halotolerans]TWG35277.1 competence CoiA-like predicted nuclease [Salisediminibacterium halotolerans]GEL06758.1 hypothetical protein SHA02_01740 [Salisediminibacterium halotolerans]
MKDNGENQSRNESAEHLTAKRMTEKWLQRYGFVPEIEAAVPGTCRRADIAVQIGKRMQAIEFQRSAIAPELFHTRTTDYLRAGYNPIWIGLKPPGVPKSAVQLISFEQLDSLCVSFKPLPHALYLDVKRMKWVFISAFLFIQPRKILIRRTDHSFEISPDILFSRTGRLLPERIDIDTCQSFLQIWKRETYLKRTQKYLRITPAERTVLSELQNFQLNLNCFPALCNIPLLTQYTMRTAPHLWQTWFVLTVLNRTPVGTALTLRQLSYKIERSLPDLGFTVSANNVHPRDRLRPLLREYLDVLCEFGALQRHFNGVYKVIHHVTVKKTMTTLLDDDAYVLNRTESRFKQYAKANA